MRRITTLAALLAGGGALLLGACRGDAPAPQRAEPAAEAASATPAEGLTVGALAPDLELQDDTGATVRLSSLRDRRPVLLAFYPKDFTGG